MRSTHAPEGRPIIVIGLGNELRGDDGAGIEVVRRIAAEAGQRSDIDLIEEQGEPLRLLHAWRGYRTAIIVDALRAGTEPGTVRRIDMTGTPIRSPVGRSASTHAVSLSDTIELGRSLDLLPGKLIVYGLEGERFTLGAQTSEPVRRAITEAADDILRELGAR